MKNIYITFFFIFISTTLFSQSPWTREKGKLFTNISFSSISDYNEIFGDPDYFTSGNISDKIYQLYTEYGLTNKTTLLVNVPFKNITLNEFRLCNGNNCAGEDFKENSLGNISLGIKYNFYNKGTIFSGQLNTEFNTGSYNANSGIRTGFDTVTFTPLFLVGKSFVKTMYNLLLEQM